MAPTLVASRPLLPPEGAGLAWGGPALWPLAPTLVASRPLLSPRGPLRLRPGEAGSAALAGMMRLRPAFARDGLALATMSQRDNES
jgi:hypothetical protein